MINELNQIKAALESCDMQEYRSPLGVIYYNTMCFDPKDYIERRKQALTLIDELIAEAGKHETN